MGRLPCELENISDSDVYELIAYSRIKGKMHNVCDVCIEKDREREKTCFFCGDSYFEDDKKKKKRPVDKQANQAILDSMIPKKKLTAEEKESIKEAWREKYKDKITGV